MFSASALRASNIGMKPILVPAEVSFTVENMKKNIIKRKGRNLLTLSQVATVKGPKGELQLEMPDFLQCKNESDKITVSIPDTENKQQKALWGTMRSLINNHIVGVTDGHLSILKLVGTGYRAQVEQKNGKPFVSLKVGASIPQGLFIPENLTVTSPAPTRIIVEGVDKQQVKLFAARLREFHPPEPYKGKGIYVDDETITLKAKKIK
jgi:large subunit ribosomal protein L6